MLKCASLLSVRRGNLAATLMRRERILLFYADCVDAEIFAGLFELNYRQLRSAMNLLGAG